MTIDLTPRKISKAVEFIMLAAILTLLLWSKPWVSSLADTRTITVTGESTIKAPPDEYVFSPYFEEKGDDAALVKENLTTLVNGIVEKLKELGVSEEDITLNASNYDRWYVYEDSDTGIVNVSMQIIVTQGDLVQKVQDYLLTLDVKGQISPQATFSQAKQDELETQATESAINDAKSKAATQAKLLDVKLGKAIKVDEFSGGGVTPFAADIATTEARDASLPVLPGQNDYSKTVTITYEIK